MFVKVVKRNKPCFNLKNKTAEKTVKISFISFLISFYLGKSDLGAAYGTSASIVILLTWIYYSSIILYFGAEFTKVYAKLDGIGITPNKHAVVVVRKEIDEKTGKLITD